MTTLVQAPIPFIQEVNAGIGSTKFAPLDRYYRRVVATKLPVTFTVPGQGSTKGDSELFIMERNYLIKVYVDPTTSGKFDDPIQTALVLLSDYLEAWEGLANDDEDYMFDDGTRTDYRIQFDYGKPITDTGVQANMEWLPNELFVGFQLTVPIIVHGGTKLR
jgi:hypothetical protein